MQSVRKKSRRGRKNSRILLLGGAAVLLAAVVIAVLLVENTPDEPLPAASTPVAVTLHEYTMEEVASITIQRGSDPQWTAVQLTPLCLTIEGEDGFTLSEEESSSLLQAACKIVADEVLTDDPTVYQDHLADYGLDAPRYVADIVYTDGQSVTLQLGDASADGAWRYMLVSGDDRLFAFSKGAMDALFVNRDTLRSIAQPTLHKARVDRITLTGPEGITAQWTLQSAITASDAIDHWLITAPFIYPADAESMTSLLSNVSNLRLGAYVCDATAEALTLYGFDAPRLTIDLHMAEGTIGNVDSEGVYVTQDWPAASCTFVIGSEKSDMVDYVLHDGKIYISSRFTMGVFLDYDVTETMSRYLVQTALGNLASLRIEADGQTTEYAITRTEQVAENNELVTDTEGNPVYDYALTKNGEPADYAAFEAAYTALLPITVSGQLPQPSASAPHTVYTFCDVNGDVRTLAFATYDALHDAVLIDGQQFFYLIKGGFKLNMD